MILYVRRKTKTMDLWVAKYWHKLFSNKEQEASEDSIHGQYEALDTEDVANAAGEGTASDFQEKGDDYSDGSGPSGDFLEVFLLVEVVEADSLGIGLFVGIL